MNCKPGDMAVLIHDPDFKEVGLFVNVIEASSEVGYWTCRRIDGKWLKGFNYFFGFAMNWRSREVDIQDSWLKPIRGDGRSVSAGVPVESPSRSVEHAR